MIHYTMCVVFSKNCALALCNGGQILDFGGHIEFGSHDNEYLKAGIIVENCCDIKRDTYHNAKSHILVKICIF